MAAYVAPDLKSSEPPMEFLAGVWDLFAFMAISRRWLIWLLVVFTALGLIAVTANFLEPGRPSF
jgi:hypothetical protein